MVFVLDGRLKPPMPCPPTRARNLHPFPIRLGDREFKDSSTQPSAHRAASTWQRQKALFKVFVGVLADCFLSTTDMGMRGFAPQLIPPPSEGEGS